MKRTLRLLLCLCIILGLCACGQKETAPTWQEQYDLGIRYLAEGNYEEAVLAFTTAIEIDPKRPESYLGLADAYEAMGDTAAAAQVIEDAIAALGELEELLVRRGQERQGDEPGFMTLLMRQEYHYPQDPATLLEEQGVVTYWYDEYGYLLGGEHAMYVYDAHLNETFPSGTDHMEFTYENDEMSEHRWWSHPDGRTEDRGTEPMGQAWPGSMVGTLTGFTGQRGLCMDPYPGEADMYWSCPSRVENPWPNAETDWAWADVTYDDRGYPVAILSYTADSALCGTAELYWEIVQIRSE